MSAVSVSTDPVVLGNGLVMIQNLGSDDLYIDVSTSASDPPSPALSSDSGLKVSSGQAASFDNANLHVWGVSAGTSDVRVLEGGSGVYGTASA